jgi:DNA-binding XRE family transcriptional regulator
MRKVRALSGTGESTAKKRGLEKQGTQRQTIQHDAAATDSPATDSVTFVARAGRPHGTKERIKSDGLKRLRAVRGWNQTQLAVTAGCSVQTIAACEQAGELPSRGNVVETLAKLARESGITWP